MFILGLVFLMFLFIFFIMFMLAWGAMSRHEQRIEAEENRKQAGEENGRGDE